MLKGFIDFKKRWPELPSQFSAELYVFTQEPQFEASFQWHSDIGCWFSVSQDSWRILAETGLLPVMQDITSIGIRALDVEDVSDALKEAGFEDCTRFGSPTDTSKPRVYVHGDGGDHVDHFDNSAAAIKFYAQTQKRGVRCAYRNAGDATPVEDWAAC